VSLVLEAEPVPVEPESLVSLVFVGLEAGGAVVVVAGDDDDDDDELDDEVPDTVEAAVVEVEFESPSVSVEFVSESVSFKLTPSCRAAAANARRANLPCSRDLRATEDSLEE
jgi:hypothetical protein